MKLSLLLISVVFSSSCWNTNLENLERKYDLKVNTIIDNHFYGINWQENNFDIRFQQISNTEIKSTLTILDSCFSVYYPEIIKNCFDEIFLVHSISFNGEKLSVMNVANLLYVAADTTEKEIINQIHLNIAEMLFDKFQYLLPANKFNELNTKEFHYGDTVAKKDLIKNGFINNRSTESLKNDFASLFVLFIENSDSLAILKAKSKIINQKLKLISNFYKSLKQTGISSISKKTQEKINKIVIQNNIKIDYAFSFFKFPNIWLKKNYQPRGKQIDEANLNILSDYISAFLEKNKNTFIPYFLKKIVIIKGLEVNQKQTNIISYNSTLFISDNSLKDFTESKYDKLIKNELFRLIYQNLSTYLPVERWRKINQNAPDSAYLSQYGQQYFYYDFRDFYFAFFDKTIPEYTKNPFFKKKLDLVQKFYQAITLEIQNINIKDIRKTITSLENQYNVKIIDFSSKPPNFYTLPHTLVINEKINVFQLKRTLRPLRNFLEGITKENLNGYLNNIFLVGNMEYLQGGSDKVGGTFETTQKSIFLANIGNSDDYIEGTLFHEFSSLILYASKKSFPKSEWLAVNDPDFSYQNLPPNQSGIYEVNETLNKKGFIDKYGTTCFENDYNEFARLFFMDKQKLESLANTYPKINQKFILLKTFFKRICFE